MSDLRRGSFLRREAYMWWCGDGCDCTQPVVEDVYRNALDSRFIIREPVWKGTFHSEASVEERAEQERELAEARERFGVPGASSVSVLEREDR